MDPSSRWPRPERGPGLAVFLNAGDPPLDRMGDVIAMLDEERVDCLELAVPFPDSVTDGAVIRASSLRALDRGVGYDETLELIAATTPGLEHLRLAAMVDWRHTIVPRSISTVVDEVAGAGADGLLVHAIPPRLRPQLHEVAAGTGLPLVSTCYATSDPGVLAEAVATAGAYLYLAASQGRTGSVRPAPPYVTEVIDRVRRQAPDLVVAVGFGNRTGADVARVHRQGADWAVVGSAFVDLVAGGPDDPRLLDRLRTFVRALRDPVALSS